MKSNNKNIDKNIKKKIEEYEFDFSDHAWDKMESLMDPTASADETTPPSRSNFNTIRNLSIMLLLLFVLYFGANPMFNSTESPPVSGTETLIQTNTTTTTNDQETSTLLPKTLPQTTETTAFNSPTSNNTSTNTNGQANKAEPQNPNKAITKGINNGITKASASPTTSLNQAAENPIDSSLLKRLNNQLTAYLLLTAAS